jgi:PAS domain S-box-containing protein
MPDLTQPRKSDLLASSGWIADVFDAFVDSIEVGLYVLDCEGVVKRVNRFILEHYGWGLDELLERNIFDLMPDLGEAGVEEKFRQVIREGKTTELTNLDRRDNLGRAVVYNLKGIPITGEGRVIGVLAVMNDITEKRGLESQVAEVEEYLQRLIDNANDIIYTLNRRGEITFLNKMGQEITGYALDPEQITPYTGYIVEKDQPKNTRHFREAIKGRPQRYATTIIASDGRLVHILINLTPIRRDGEVVGVLGIARDITERKQMQAQLLQASKMAAIGELAAGVAHEINNPVGIISGAAEQLQFLLDRVGGHPPSSGRPDKMDGKFVAHVEMIREQADRCKRITQGLLNFARKTEMRRVEVDIAKLVGEAVALLKNRAADEDKNIEALIPANLPPLAGDPHLLEQVFLNLANNALDAVEAGGEITITARAQRAEISIDVADNGSGIDEENLKKIFDPFFTTKAIGKGTGLGLSICFGIVERMGGTISVRSKPGAGTTFTVRFPLEPERTT